MALEPRRRGRRGTKSAARATRGFLPIATTTSALRPLKSSEAVARDIVDAIVVRRLKQGDGLPPEAMMLAEYGVSRDTLREGLRLLEVQGLITLRRGPGGGPVVGSVDPANLGRTGSLYYHLVGATYAELFEAWVLGEKILAELAARNPDRILVRETLSSYMESAHTDAESLDEFVAHHVTFHAAIASLAQNRVLQIDLRSFGLIIAHHVAVNADPRDAGHRIEVDHVEIAHAIIAGHRIKARDLMEAHIRSIMEIYQRELGPQMQDVVDWR